MGLKHLEFFTFLFDFFMLFTAEKSKLLHANCGGGRGKTQRERERERKIEQSSTYCIINVHRHRYAFKLNYYVTNENLPQLE